MAERAARPQGHVSFHDSSVAVWEEPAGCTSAYEEGFRAEVFGALVRVLRKRGWRVGRDEMIHRNFRSLSPSHRYCTHPSRLEATVEVSGRTIKLELFQSIANRSNIHGARYDFDKLDRMPYLLRLRAIAELFAVSEWLCSTFGYAPPGVSRADMLGCRAKTNRQIVDESWEKSGHRRKADSEIQRINRVSADRTLLQSGERVWWTDSKGRWVTGTAEADLNNVWWVLWGRTGLAHVASFNLHRQPPACPRGKANAKIRERRLRELMSAAARDERFLRAEQLRRVIAADRRAE